MSRRALRQHRLSRLHGFFFLALLGTVGAGLVTGCSSDAPSKVCARYEPPSAFDPNRPAVSFSNDVMPIFGRACAFADCHGGNPPEGDLFLGKGGQRVFANLVSAPAKILPTMQRVVPGDAANSFLLRKLDDDACVIAGCTGACSESMPQALDQLPESERLIIRAWVLQGAVNDIAGGAAGATQ